MRYKIKEEGEARKGGGEGEKSECKSEIDEERGREERREGK